VEACRNINSNPKTFEELLPHQKEILINGKENHRLKGFFDWMEGKDTRFTTGFLSKYWAYTPCPTCHNTRLKEEALLWFLAEKNISELRHAYFRSSGVLQEFADPRFSKESWRAS
jgi:excinuclease UvrABC ATPase subunit